MITYVQDGLQYCLGIVTLLSFILLLYCIYTKQDINTWQFPMFLALLLDSIFIFSTLQPSYHIQFNSNKQDNIDVEQKGLSPHLPIVSY
jgi:hypothetical protein